MAKNRRVKSARKFSCATSERTVPAEETLARARRVAAEKGVTRLVNITGLDRLGIPVYSAIVPRSDDAISVYNGKGATEIDSRAGALMEAIERQTVLYANLPIREGSYRNLRSERIPAIDPQLFSYKLWEEYDDKNSYLWIQGYDLIGEEPVLVPAGVAGYGPKYGENSPYETYGTNGLASGNCFEEALCHACVNW